MKAFCKFCGKEGELGRDVVAATGHVTGCQTPLTYRMCADEADCKRLLIRKEYARRRPNGR